MGGRAMVAGCATATAALIVTAACSGSGRSVSAFCSRLAKDRDSLVAVVSDPAGVKKALASYEAVDAVAPEAIRDDWHQVTTLVQRASTINPTKTDDTSALVSDAFASSEAVQKVTAYSKATCGVDLAATTTTLPPAPSTTASRPPTSG
jgi:hypothetical protein